MAQLLSVCLRLRSCSQSPGLEPHNRGSLLGGGGGLLLLPFPLLVFPPLLSLSVNWINEIFKKKIFNSNIRFLFNDDRHMAFKYIFIVITKEITNGNLLVKFKKVSSFYIFTFIKWVALSLSPFKWKDTSAWTLLNINIK